MKSVAIQTYTSAAASRTLPGRSRWRVSKKRETASCWSCRIRHSQPNAIHNATGQPNTPPQHSPESSLMSTGIPVK